MTKNNSLSDRINSVKDMTFESVAIDLFHHQYQHNRVYQHYVNILGREPQNVTQLCDIPFLPISLFKKFDVKTGEWLEETVFESSGTTGSVNSKHLVRNESSYIAGCLETFEAMYGPLGQYQLLALLPSYLERGNSGLVSMVNAFVSRAKDGSGFYLNEYQELYDQLQKAKEIGISTILWGVTFALLDFIEAFEIQFPELIVMETGGMKGRREEMIRADVHSLLKSAFGVKEIHSEYGMTELFSQAYSKGGGIFSPSRIMKVMARDLNDPFNYPLVQRTGGLNIIDLANYNTCAFIETQDMGRVYENGTFEVLGRVDNSEMRGCNLMIV